MRKCKKIYDVVVVGGGISGVCAALAAARHGAKTALIQNRPVLGGNASSEIKVNINGAGRHGNWKKDLQETGIIREILHEVKKENPQNSFHVQDMVLWSMVNRQAGLDLYLNTHFWASEVREGRIDSIQAMQYTTETMYTFQAKIFADTTGDAALAYESGADWTIGREARRQYGEPHAPETADLCTMGSTVMFTTVDMGRKVEFHKPEWAYTFTKEQLGARKIAMLNHGYWWVELGGAELAVIEDSESIRDELYKWALGVFDYIKNCGEYDADHLALDWICSVPGRRESRRIVGDYVLNENDVYEGRRFQDAIAYGGWTMDNHTVGGITAKGESEEGTKWLPIKDIYTIPYRCVYSRNIDNLYVGGRALSVSHMAMSSTRVIATCGVIGEAIGTAAAMAAEKHMTPRELGKLHLKDLQQALIRDDCFLPGIQKEDEEDLCRNALGHIAASSFTPGAEPEKTINGYARNIDGVCNAWISQELGEAGNWIEFTLNKEAAVKEIHIKFDSNLTDTLNTTLVNRTRERQPRDMPAELVKKYRIDLYRGETPAFHIEENDNIHRFRKHKVDCKSPVTRMRLTVLETYGDRHARVFEVGMYS